jgi:hypothetical protein
VNENDKIFIECHQGLGDHLICAGLYLDLASKASQIVIPVRKRYQSEVARLTQHMSNIETISYPDFYFREMTIAHSSIVSKRGFRSLKLGYFGDNFLQLADRFDEAFYVQANVGFQERWNQFTFFEDKIEQLHVYKELVGDTKSYAFVHDDAKRGYKINQQLISSNLKIIRPISRGTSIFDYKLVIERATEIHCIESSFSAFIESINIQNPRKFIHRYSRPEATNDSKHEATYKSNWNIYTLGQS